jgi:hypothetical protein
MRAFTFVLFPRFHRGLTCFHASGISEFLIVDLSLERSEAIGQRSTARTAENPRA